MKKVFIILIAILISVPAFGQYIAQDPTRYIPNARVIGLGKAYIGLADDAASIYTNPAGLAEAKGWQLSSMSGQFLGEYNFLSFSGLYATDFGVLGLGFAGTSITGAYATTIEPWSDPADPVYTIDYTQPTMGNYNNAFVLSYGNEAEKIPYINRIPFADKISLGTSLKIFQVALYGDGIVNGNATGQELDLGMKFQPDQKWMKFGATLQNALPASMGGKLSYAYGHEESYPAVLEVGSAFNLIGEEDSLYRLGNQKVIAMIDFDMHPTLSNYPMVWHLGLEWKPMDIISLRTGIDQDVAGDGAGGLEVVSDMAYGVGVGFGGFRFDYAYHTFSGAPNMDNHFFSLCYIFEPPVIPKDPIMVEVPPDKWITFETKTPLEGQVVDSRIRKLTINGIPIKFGLRGEFKAVVDLKIGKNGIMLDGFDGGKKNIAQKKIRVLRLIIFPDVATDYWVAMPISILAMDNIITGYPDGTFKPAGNITRAEMCTLLMKTLASTEEFGSVTPFTDVDEGHWAAPYIVQAAELGIVKGYPDGSFKPKSNITRAEGLVMISRFAKLEKAPYEISFADVRADHWAADIITGASKAGVLKYLEGKKFEPNKKLSRAETVEILFKTQFVQDILAKGILDWDSY